MSNLEQSARMYWFASFQARRAPERNQRMTIRVLVKVIQSNRHPLAGRAAELAKQIIERQRNERAQH